MAARQRLGRARPRERPVRRGGRALRRRRGLRLGRGRLSGRSRPRASGGAPPATALVTGAAAGIGAAFARALAAQGCRLVLVDRDGDRLRHTAAALDTATATMTADLTVEEELAGVERRCRDGVDLLVNSAGFGHRTEFLATPVAAEVAMLRLHTEAVLRLTLAALPSMVERRRGGVINVASVLGLFPSSTYSATKSWVINFSRATARHTAADQVAVMALCPGFTRTAFHGSAGMRTDAVPEALWLDADDVAAAALRDWRRGKRLSVPGWHYKAVVAAAGVLPPWLVDRLLSRTAMRAPAGRS